MSETTKPKEYQITTLSQIQNIVTEENYENLCTDFITYMGIYLQQIKAIRESNPELCEGKLNSEIAECAFIWIDDGKNDYKGTWVKSNETGEIIYHENKADESCAE